MATLTAKPRSALPPSWDETIVPSLRKRLESESRILTKRLSTISITDESSSLNTPSDVQHTSSPPQNHVGDYSDPSAAAYPQRPSAIPRPSYARVGERAAASPSPPPQRLEPIGKPVSKRKRTQSTPFSFNHPNHPIPSGSALPNGHHANGMPAPSSSTSISPRVQSPSLGGRATPSRIPTVASRVRSGSQSSQGFGSLNGAKSSLPPSHKFSPPETQRSVPEPVESSFTSEASPPMSASDSNIAPQRIVDERPPFTNDPSPKVLESEFTDRPSIEEERTFQHWYRGDVSRNGGVGEYRVGKRMEMLDIANYGHALRASTGRTRAYEEPTPRSEGVGVGPRKRAESVSSREQASIYIDPQDETVAGNVLDETPLTDIEADETDYERDHYSQVYDPQEFGVQHSSHQVPPTNHNRPLAGPPSIFQSRLPLNKSQSRIPQTKARSNTLKESTSSIPAATSELSVLVKGNERERSRTQAPPNTRSKPAAKINSQKRSKSAVDASRSPPERRDSSDYVGLADAVPESSSPVPRNRNWDEVILPTVARRMGIEYEKETPEAAAKRKARESCVAPAPGTFGYDHTKYKPPRPDEAIHMDEFGQQQSDFVHEQPEDQQYASGSPSEELPHDPASKALRSRRETMPPFSQYAHPPDDRLSMSVPDPERKSRGRRRERQDVPQILVSPPSTDAADGDKTYMDEGQGVGCCKCVIM